MTMKHIFAILIVISFTALMFCSSENQIVTTDPEIEPLQNKVWLESDLDTLDNGMKIAVEVYMENNQPITGLVIPLSFQADNLSLDSISLIGSRFEDFAHRGYDITEGEMSMLVYAYSTTLEEILDSASNLAFTMYFWIWGNAQSQEFTIDSTFISPSSRLQYMDENLHGFTPEFVSKTFYIDGIEAF